MSFLGYEVLLLCYGSLSAMGAAISIVGLNFSFAVRKIILTDIIRQPESGISGFCDFS